MPSSVAEIAKQLQTARSLAEARAVVDRLDPRTLLILVRLTWFMQRRAELDARRREAARELKRARMLRKATMDLPTYVEAEAQALARFREAAAALDRLEGIANG